MKPTTPCVYQQMVSKNFLLILSKLSNCELAVSFGIKLVWKNVPVEASGGERLCGDLVAVIAPSMCSTSTDLLHHILLK